MPIEKLEDEETLHELKAIAKPFVLRRLKTDEDIKKELPEKFINDIYCTLTKKQIKLYNAILEEIFFDIENSKGIQRKGIILKILTALKQTCNHPAQFLSIKNPKISESGKMELLVNILENILDNDEKVIIFTQYVEMGKLIQQLISKKFKQEVLFLHGSQTREEKSRIINTFQEDENYKIFVATLKTGGTGINLTAAQKAELKGDKGDPGPRGLQGEPGEKGDRGERGPQGLSGISAIEKYTYNLTAGNSTNISLPTSLVNKNVLVIFKVRCDSNLNNTSTLQGNGFIIEAIPRQDFTIHVTDCVYIGNNTVALAAGCTGKHEITFIGLG